MRKASIHRSFQKYHSKFYQKKKKKIKHSIFTYKLIKDYALELFYRESWLDQRLRYQDHFKDRKISLHESYINFLWHPDTFMPNALASKNPQKHSISHRSLLRLNFFFHYLTNFIYLIN